MGSFEGMYEQTYIYQNIVGNSKYRLEVENVSMSGIGEGQRCALLSLGCRTPREMWRRVEGRIAVDPEEY